MRLSTTFLVIFSLLAGLPGRASTHGHDGRTSQLTMLAYHAEQTTVPTLNVFPNPSCGQLTVQVTGQAGQDYKLRLANVLGREVRLLTFRPEQAAAGLAIDLTGLPTGLYFYSLLVNDKIVSTRRLTLQGD